MARPQGPYVRTSTSHECRSVINIREIQKTKAIINSSRRNLSKTIKTFSSWYGDLMLLYWLISPQGYDDYLEKNCNIDF
jgi:hypothetical protein